jgi:hypothetical protein
MKAILHLLTSKSELCRLYDTLEKLAPGEKEYDNAVYKISKDYQPRWSLSHLDVCWFRAKLDSFDNTHGGNDYCHSSVLF